MPIKPRAAGSEDLNTLSAWDRKPHMISSSGVDDDWDWENQLPRSVSWREFWIYEIDGRPIGFVQIIDPKEEESHYWGDCEADLRAIDIWIGEEQFLGRGYGTEMMRHAIAHCFEEHRAKAILVDPMAHNTRAHRFYRRFGFEEVGPSRFGPDDCIVFRLDRQRWL